MLTRVPSLMVILLLCAALAACSGDEHPAPPASGGGGAAPERAEPVRAPGREVVAIVDGGSVTADEVDGPIRLQLYDLERLQFELRRKRLREIVMERLLGPAAEAAKVPLAIYIDRRAREWEARTNGGATGAAAEKGALPQHVARYEAEKLREAFIDKTLADADVRILLEPPEPPVLDVDPGPGPFRGSADAPVTIVAFTDLQSPYSRRAEPTLRSVLDAYPGQVRIAYRDLPMYFHAQARQAAEALRCAGAQGAYWRYQEVLFQNQTDLTRDALDAYARRIELDAKAFDACLDDERFAAAVAADLAEANRLGVNHVPTFFVDGRYLKGPQPFEGFAALIDRELQRKGLLRRKSTAGAKAGGPAGDAYADARPSRLPLVLVGTLAREDPDLSTASIRHRDAEVAGTFRPGDKVLPDVSLARVERARVYLRNKGVLEYLPLARTAGGQVPGGEAGGAAANATEAPAAQEGVEPAPPPPEAILTLTRKEVDEGLADRQALAQALRPGKLDLEGRRLLKLSQVPPGSLYEKLGLKPRDVLMQVNGEWVHDAHNPLWDLLADPDAPPTTLTIMRGGFPHTFEYRVEGTP